MKLELYAIGFNDGKDNYYINTIFTKLNNIPSKVEVRDIVACKEDNFIDLPYIKLFASKEIANNYLEGVKEYFANKGGNEEVYLVTLNRVD